MIIPNLQRNKPMELEVLHGLSQEFSANPTAPRVSGPLEKFCPIEPSVVMEMLYVCLSKMVDISHMRQMNTKVPENPGF